MKIWIDTEFVDRGTAIDANTDLISLGMVREDGEELYVENAGALVGRELEWLHKNVMPKLGDPKDRLWLPEIAKKVLEFCGGAMTRENRRVYDHPQFWAYFASYDWILLCKLFGSLMNLPAGWPMYCRDVRQYMMHLGLHDEMPGMPFQTDRTRHHALEDARWLRDLHVWIDDRYVLEAKELREGE